MAEILSMPKLGFDMAEGTLVRWVIQEGQVVTRGKVIAEIETDKATVEVECGLEGTVLVHLAKEGDIIPVKTPIAVIGKPGETVDYKALGIEAPGGSAAPAAPAAVETPAPAAPAAQAAAPVAQAVETPADVDPALPGGVRASPLARKLAAERGLDLRKVKASGPGGRIVRADVLAYKEPAAPAVPAAAVVPAASQAAPAAPAPVFAAREDVRIPVSRLRSAISRRMTEAKQQIPHFYVTHEYKLEALMALRKQVNSMLPEADKVSVNDFIVKAAALTLREFPNLNASIDLPKGEIVQHGHVNVGIAVAVEQGLLTVVCRDADLKSLRQIGSEIRTLANKARDGKVRPEDIEGSTFSISNLGMFDVEHFVAIINPPEAAILAVGSGKEVPVVENGAIKVGMRMKATISVDHRVSDGAEAARFMQRLALYIEEPLRLML